MRLMLIALGVCLYLKLQPLQSSSILNGFDVVNSKTNLSEYMVHLNIKKTTILIATW